MKKKAGWEFDTAAGRLEILYRRIGRNELDAIQTCLAFVDAQNEYAEKDRRRGRRRLCAAHRQHHRQEGRPLLAAAMATARWANWPRRPPPKATRSAQGRIPYHGYYYRILTQQGPNAPGGALDYVVKGKMIGGFALLAYPAEYGNSGVMTFLVNHSGVVYQKDLGDYTMRLVKRMNWFDPDQTWKKVDASSK